MCLVLGVWRPAWAQLLSPRQDASDDVPLAFIECWIDETLKRNDISTDELMVILETGYKGHVGQEFIPKREDKLASLEQGVRICDV